MEQHECRHCGWVGRGADLVQGEVFDALFEADCPRCGGRVTTVTFPTLAESRANWDTLSRADKLTVELVEAHLDGFERRKLSRPDQLPDLHGEDIESRDGGDRIIRFGDLVVWREPAFYEGYERFVEVAGILAQKYGSRLQDLVPSRASELYLYGDRSASLGVIKNCREQLRTRRNAS
jgi:hypothetical protein